MPLDTPLDLVVFQGPLDLLLELIEQRRLAVTDVSLASVADQYLQAVRALPQKDPDLLGEFLVIAARLLVLKSRALLPRPAEPEVEEPIDDLAARLELYRRFKEAAVELGLRLESGSQSFPHPSRPHLQHSQPPLAPIDSEILARLWRSIHRRQPARPNVPAPLQPRVSVDDRLRSLRRLLSQRTAVPWEEVAGETVDEVVATFLALLELVRRSELRVKQEHTFGPILLLANGSPAVAANHQASRREAEQLG